MAIEAQLREDWGENHVRHGAFYNDNTLFTGDEIGVKYGRFTSAQIGEMTGDFEVINRCFWVLVTAN